MSRKLAALTALVFMLAGCGGSPPRSVTEPPSPTLHQCSTHNQAMQCVLQTQPPPQVSLTPRGVTSASLGVDFTGWGGCPSPSGRAFGLSYLSYDSSKDWSSSCLATWHGAGSKTGAVFEASGTPTNSAAVGAQDARAGAAELARDGAPSNYPVRLAIDCDCSFSQYNSYFQGANQAEPGRIDAYGGYNQILGLYNAHLVGHDNWQTYAWSGGRWLPASIAPLEQYLNDSSVDYDRWLLPLPSGGWLYASNGQTRTICWGKGSTPGSSSCRKIEAQAKHYWVQYKAFHKAIPGHKRQLGYVNRRISILVRDSAHVQVSSYSGPGQKWLTKQIRSEDFYGSRNWTLHHKTVYAHHG